MYTNRLASRRSIDLTCNYQTLHFEPSLIPIIVEGLLKGKPDGKNPEDIFVKTLSCASEETYKAILVGWEAMSAKEKKLRYQLDKRSINKGAWVDRLESQTKSLLEYRKNVKIIQQKLIKKEFHHALSVGPANWQPSEELQKNKTLSYIVQRNIWERFTMPDKPKNICCSRADADDDSQREPNYGIKLTKITCHENDEIGHDEIYTISVVIDNNGTPILETSKVYDLNDSDDNVVYPNKWLYPMKNPNGYLDCAVTLWEDDGGYDEAAKAAAALALGLGAIPDVTATKVAALALGVISGLLFVGGWLDSDDEYGDITKTWSSDTQLQSGVGEFIDSVINYDEGWTDFTSYHYEIQFELLSS